MGFLTVVCQSNLNYVEIRQSKCLEISHLLLVSRKLVIAIFFYRGGDPLEKCLKGRLQL